MSARHFELLKRPGLIVPEAALRRRSINYSGSKPPVLTYRDQGAINANGVHTHSGMAFGPADTKRALIVLSTCNGNNIAGISSMTIGGVAATRCAKGQTSKFTNAFSSEIWIAAVPSGTSGSVVLTGFGDVNWDSSVAIYSVLGLKSLTPTATDIDRDALSLSTSVSVLSGGVVVSGAYSSDTSQTSATWSGCVQDFFARFQGNLASHTGGSLTSTIALTLSVNTTFPSGIHTLNCCAATASFR